MQIIDMKVEQLVPYHKNPRQNSAAVQVVKTSLEEYGFKQPIVVDENNEIIVGHTRFSAALELGLTSVPVLVADDLTDDQVTAYRIMDNRSAEFADWDEALYSPALHSKT
jgi:ParB/RepB/Spo0J family partition protein